MFDIDMMSRVPIYEQLYKKIVELVIGGALKEGDQLPSVRSLAKELGINPNTIAKSYQELERSGIITSLSNRGSFVADVKRESAVDYMLRDYSRCVVSALRAGVTKDELKIRIDKIDKIELN